MPRVLGLDVSANRIAWALAGGAGECETGILRRGRNDFTEFVHGASGAITRFFAGMYDPDAYCLEVNLHPNIIHKGHIAPKMIKAYMRSRWVEGALLGSLLLTEPRMIQKMPGGFHKIPAGDVFALQASGGKDAKLKRRQRMTLHYGLQSMKISEDEIDALAVAHECVIALTTGVRQEAK